MLDRAHTWDFPLNTEPVLDVTKYKKLYALIGSIKTGNRFLLAGSIKEYEEDSVTLTFRPVRIEDELITHQVMVKNLYRIDGTGPLAVRFPNAQVASSGSIEKYGDIAVIVNSNLKFLRVWKDEQTRLNEEAWRWQISRERR